jgi:hypothetical protein
MLSWIMRMVGVVAFTALLCGTVVAQNTGPTGTRDADLKAMAAQLRERAQQGRKNAEVMARLAGIPFRKNLSNSRVLELQRFVPGRGPVYYITNNADAAATVSTDVLWPGGLAGLNLDGAGMVVGEWDGGAIYSAHPDLAGRVTQIDGAATISNHSTHVAGTLIGAGAWLLPEARGMAFAASLDAYDWNLDAAEMATAAANGMLLSNHSYGIAAGWIYIGDPEPETWWWIGGSDPADVEDPYFGYYDTEAQSWDQIARNAPYYLIVKAAGNDGSDIGPGPSEEYTVIDQEGDPLFVSDLPRNQDCTPTGYDCLPTHSVAKNILTVGAVDDIPGGYSPITGADAVLLADFSSRGPTDDGRIKPDLVGNGVLLLSTWSETPFYAAAAGTSMAAPNVTGSLLLLQQHYENIHGLDQYLLAATLKALVIHTADEAGAFPGPDYWFGWGLLNTQKAADLITDDGSGPIIIEGSLGNGAIVSHEYIVSEADTDVVATLVWADPAATPVALSLDPQDLMLVNDLDLRIERDGITYEPWVLYPESPASAAGRGDNFRDNVEQVIVTGGGAGSYTIKVSHKNGLLGNETQDYSLIISERAPPLAGSELLIDEDFSGGLPADWSVSTESGVSWEIRAPLVADSRYDNLSGGVGNFAMVDNNYINESYTGLISPLLDLSDNTAVVLRFNSYMIYDTWESINVDVSTDGGASWLNAWTFQGFNPLPTPYVIDLTDGLAGEANARFRFWWSSGGFISGDLWQVDDVSLEVFGGQPPSQSEMCSGSAVDVQDHVFTGQVNCTASVSFTLHGNVIIAAGAEVRISAPTVSLGPGITVESGALLSVSFQP